MNIDISDGVVIEGTAEELEGLAQDLSFAAEANEEVEASMPTSDGVERVTIRCIQEDQHA
jgi:hypothetical protein